MRVTQRINLPRSTPLTCLLVAVRDVYILRVTAILTVQSHKVQRVIINRQRRTVLLPPRCIHRRWQQHRK